MSCVDDLGNAFQTSILCSLIFNDVFRIIVEYLDQIQAEIYVLTCFVVFVVLTITIIFITKYFRKKINLTLSYSQLYNQTDLGDNETLRTYEPTLESKFLYFDELKLDKNIKKAMIYLMVGFSSCSELFIDYSFIQFCMEKYEQVQKMNLLLLHLLVYFKSEEKKLDIVMNEFHSYRDLDLYGRFLFYQVNRVKTFRQATPTNNSIIKLNELKMLSKNLENQIKIFWSLPAANTSTLDQMEEQQRNLNNLWDESIEDNWCSVSFREEHIRFLIESCTDFPKAVQMENIKNKINILRNDRDDLCFLSLLLCFPQYISNKNTQIEVNEDDIKKISKNSSSESKSTSHYDKELTSSSDYDFTIEEQIANSIMSFGRLRLPMMNALKYSRPFMSKFLVFYSIFSILVSFILIILTFAIYLNSFDSFDDWNRQVGVLVELRVAYAKSFLSLSILYGKKTNRFSVDPIYCTVTNVLQENRFFLEQNVDFESLSEYYADEARDEFTSLMEAITQLSMERAQISTLTDLIFGDYIDSSVCINGEIIDHISWSMEKTVSFDLLSFSYLSKNNSNVANWFSNDSLWCHSITTFPYVESMFTVIQNELTYDLSNSSDKRCRNTRIEMIVIGPCFFLICVLPLPIIIIFYSKEINNLIEIMLSTDQDFKDQAKINISLLAPNEYDNLIPPMVKLSYNWKFFLFSLLIIICFGCYITFEELILYYCKETNYRIRNIGFYTCYFSLVRAYLIEILIETMNSVYIVNASSHFISVSDFESQIYNLLKAFENMVYEILNDTPDSPSSVGKDKEIDDIVLSSYCNESTKIYDLHDAYKCASLNQLLSVVHVLVVKIIEEKKNYNGIFGGEEINNLYHIIFAHSVQSILNIINRFSSIQQNEINKFNGDIIIFFVCGIVFVFIWSFIMIYINVKFQRIFQMAICLIRRLSPVGLISNNELTNYLLRKKSETVDMGVSHTIFNNSFDGIICITIDGTIEIVNRSFSNDYGYSTEQLIGQLIGIIFDDTSKEKIENQLKLIQNHESKNYYTEDVICITNDGRAVPSFITLFSIKDNENYLILIVRDQTVLLQKKKKLELAKKKSQDLLEQIIPPKILMMLKEGKSEISFTVPSATVMFVNIVNFSGFSADLSPQQIMGTLSTLFGAFDVWIQKYPLMTKIKLIGDSYMAACGLFSDDNNPTDHAKQCTDFGLHVLTILEDANIKLNVMLQIRIGINSGGPIIAGVLGTENRVFDIIGDTINVASRLEHKSDPGHILMSEKTYELVKNCEYHITFKGQVFLKGKGNMNAFSI